MTTAICGAISAQGSHQLLNRTRFSTAMANSAQLPPRAAGRAGEGCFIAAEGEQGLSLVRLLEALELLVAALDGAVESFLGGLLAAPDLLHFLVDDGADLH